MTGTPRDLDPNFKDATPTNTDTTTNVKETPSAKDDDVPMIALRQQFIGPDGVPTEKVHGPMPVTEWPAYEKKNGL